MKPYLGHHEQSEQRLKVRNKDILRKKFPKNFDQTAVDHKHLALLPYNINNHFLTIQDVANIFAKVDMTIPVQSLALYQQAFVHSSYIVSAVHDDDNTDPRTALRAAIPDLIRDSYDGGPFLPVSFKSKARQSRDADFEKLMPLQRTSSERLEFLGDSVCGMCVAAYLYDRYPDQDEGFMTRLRTRLVCGSRLGEFANVLGLHQHVILSRYVELVNNGRSNYKVLEDIFEAFVGALYLDNGSDASICHRFLVAIMEKHIDFADLIYNDQNYKDQLLRSFQKFYDGAFPIYREISVDVKDGSKVYTMGVLNPEGTYIVGTGSSVKKRQSEQLSSLEALKYYGWLDKQITHNTVIDNDIKQ